MESGAPIGDGQEGQAISSVFHWTAGISTHCGDDIDLECRLMGAWPCHRPAARPLSFGFCFSPITGLAPGLDAQTRSGGAWHPVAAACPRFHPSCLPPLPPGSMASSAPRLGAHSAHSLESRARPCPASEQGYRARWSVPGPARAQGGRRGRAPSLSPLTPACAFPCNPRPLGGRSLGCVESP